MRNKTVDKVNNRHKGSDTGEHRMCLQTSLWSDAVRNEGKLGTELAEGEPRDAGWDYIVWHLKYQT